MTGTVTGKVTIFPGIKMTLNGTATKGVIVNKQSELLIEGTIYGIVENNGGNVSLYGTMYGDIINNGGKVFIDQNSVTYPLRENVNSFSFRL